MVAAIKTNGAASIRLSNLVASFFIRKSANCWLSLSDNFFLVHVTQTGFDVFLFYFSAFFTRHLVHGRQRRPTGFLLHDFENLSEIFAATVGEYIPVLLRHARHLERISRNHLKRKFGLRIGFLNRRHYARQIEYALTQWNFREQKAVLVRLYAHIFHMC